MQAWQPVASQAYVAEMFPEMVGDDKLVPAMSPEKLRVFDEVPQRKRMGVPVVMVMFGVVLVRLANGAAKSMNVSIPESL